MAKKPTAKQLELAKLLRDSVTWGEHYLKNRDGSKRKYWTHQAEDLRSISDQIVHMDGRDSGKTIALVGNLLHYAFTTLGGSVLVAAPYQGHLDTIIDEFEYQIDHVPDLLASIARNRRGDIKITRKPYFTVEFTNGTVVHFRPAGDGGASFRSLHVDRLYVDEGAWIPERAWESLRMCLNSGGGFRIYSTPNGLRNTTYYRLTQSPDWKCFHWPSWISPQWNDEREKKLMGFYGGKHTSGWMHEVAGEHGMPSWGAFNLEQFFGCLTEIPEYLHICLTGDDFSDCDNEAAQRERIEMSLNLAPHDGVYWLGGDLGYTNDPTELVLFREEEDNLRMVLRVHAEHVAYPVISELIAVIDRAYRPAGIGVDNGGNGLSVVQELTGLDKFKSHKISERLHGFDFGGSTIIGYEEDKPLKKRTKEYMTSLINAAINHSSIEFPDSDRELTDQFATHTYHRGERHVIYSKGNDHVIDAVRCAMLAKEMKQLDRINPTVEEVYLEVLITDPIFR